MLSAGLCRARVWAAVMGRLSWSGARHNPVLVCGSEVVEEGQEGVGGAVASGGCAGWCGAGEGAFLDGHVGVEVELG